MIQNDFLHQREHREYEEEMKKFDNAYLAKYPIFGHLATKHPGFAFFICFLIGPWILIPIQMLIGQVLSVTSVTRSAVIIGLIGGIISYFMGKNYEKKISQYRSDVKRKIISKRKDTE